MVTYDTQRAKDAVQYLVDTPYFQHHLKRLRSTVGRPRSLPFRGDAEPLNELLRIGRQNLEAMENLIHVAEFKRSDRNTYQRQYMAQKRARDHKVIELEQLLQGRKLNLDKRHAVLVKQYELWNKERDQFLAARSEEYEQDHDEKPDWMTMNRFRQMFWDTKDQELDALIAEANKVLAGRVAHRKRVVTVERPAKDTSLRRAMLAALDKRK